MVDFLGVMCYNVGMSSERISKKEPFVSAAEAEMRDFRANYAIEEPDDPRTLTGELVPDYLKEVVTELGASAVRQEREPTTLPVEYFYSQNIADINKGDIYMAKGEHFNLNRSRTSFETKQDLILAVATVFVNYSSEGRRLGYMTQFPEDRLEDSNRSRNYYAARDFIITAVDEATRQLKPENWQFPKDSKTYYLPFEQRLQNIVSAEDVDWFGPTYRPRSGVASDRVRVRFEKIFGQSFATQQVYKEGTKPPSGNMAKKRNNYLKTLSAAVTPELEQYKQEKK